MVRKRGEANLKCRWFFDFWERSELPSGKKGKNLRGLRVYRPGGDLSMLIAGYRGGFAVTTGFLVTASAYCALGLAFIFKRIRF